MEEPKLPPNETERIARLHSLDMLDTSAEERFDRLTRIAALALDVPIALVSLVDVSRQWFKSKTGLDTAETPRNVSFCGHAILSDRTFVVDDALADTRFADNPLVLGAPNVRFYAGHPLDDGAGFKLGTLCVIDHQPRSPSPRQLALLAELAELVEMELRSIGLERAVRQHEESLAKVDAITDSLIDAVITVGEDATIRSFNPAAERIFGYERHQVLGASASMLFSSPIPDLCPPRSPETEPARPGGPVARGLRRELEGQRRDGARFTMDLAVSPATSGGEPISIWISRDISEDKQAEDALRASETRFRTLTEMAPVGIFRTDAGGDCVYVNQRWCDITGVHAASALGGGWMAVIHPDDAAEVERAWKEATSSGEEFALEFRFLRPTGQHRWVSARAVPIDGQSLPGSGHLGTIQDVTDEFEARDQLRASEELHRSVIAAMSEGILIQDRTTRIVGWNAAAGAILGLAPADLRERSSLDLCPRMVREDGTPMPAIEHPAMRSLMTGEPMHDVIVGVYTPNEELRWLSVNAQPLARGDEATPWGVACTFTDITDRRAVDRMKSEFVSVVSHELRTPLTSIRGALGLLAGGKLGQLDAKPQRMLDIAVTNTDRLVRLINDILDIERIESGQASLVKRECDSADLITQAIEVMQPLADRAEVRLEADSGPAELRVDPDRIIQTLTNLISNAIKFSPAGATVTVGRELRDGRILFRVTDEGRGIPPDKLASIFERFQQVDASDSRDKGGTGLGLAICRSIVDQHGGDIWVESTLGRGSTFWFSVSPPCPSASSPTPERPPHPTSAADSESLSSITRRLLESQGADDPPSWSRERVQLLADAHLPGVVGLGPPIGDHAPLDSPTLPRSGVVTGARAEIDIVGWIDGPLRPKILADALRHRGITRTSQARVLIVEDDPDLGGVLVEVFEQSHLRTHLAPTIGQALVALEEFAPDLVVLDLGLPDGNGLSVVDELVRQHPDSRLPIVVYTARPVGAHERLRSQALHTEFYTKGYMAPDALARRAVELLLQMEIHQRGGTT